jgi:hypothetical protein
MPCSSFIHGASEEPAVDACTALASRFHYFGAQV